MEAVVSNLQICASARSIPVLLHGRRQEQLILLVEGLNARLQLLCTRWLSACILLSCLAPLEICADPLQFCSLLVDLQKHGGQMLCT
jgi:hypothetical protein